MGFSVVFRGDLCYTVVIVHLHKCEETNMYTDNKGRKWFKGNLHMHTTESDGKLTPAEAAALYAENGYDFIARTDHWKVGPADEFEGLLCLTGCEYNIGATPKEGVFHIVGVGMETDPQIRRSTPDNPLTGQEIVDTIHRFGGIAIIAHPAWSLNSPEQILSIHRDTPFDMTEIYNSTSDMPRNCRPYSGLITDMLASSGVYLPLGAADDSHLYAVWDRCRSYIWVQAEECTRDAILTAIREGKFYATQGPKLDVRLEDGKVVVDCDPVEEIVYHTDSVWTGHRSDVGENLTHGEYVPTAIDTFVRVEVKDKDGKYGWSQYVQVKK